MRMDSIDILIDEDHGARHWIWTPPHETLQEVKQYWDSLNKKELFDGKSHFDVRSIKGHWNELLAPDKEDVTEDVYDFFTEKLNIKNYKAYGQFHHSNDSYMVFPKGV